MTALGREVGKFGDHANDDEIEVEVAELVDDEELDDDQEEEPE